jgi:DUF4097 and DUF4098 domain-containing protein YvlB
MPRRRTPTAVALLFAAFPALVSAQDSKTYTLEGQDVAVYDLVGQVTLEQGTGSSVQLEIRRGGADAAKLRVEQTTIRGRPTIRVVFPDDHIVYSALGPHSNSQFSINEDGTWGEGGRQSRRIWVRGDGNGLEAYADITIKVPEGQRLAVYLGVGKLEASNVSGDLKLDASSGNIRLSSVSGSINADTGSGNVEATGSSGSLNIDTGSGDVRLTTFKGTKLTVDTGSGNVEASQIEVPVVSVETGSGNITLSSTTCTDLNVNAGSGDVDVALTGDVAAINAETGSGNVTLRVPESLGAELHLETGSGDFRVDFPVQLIRKEEGKLVARVGDGQGRIGVETGSGDVILKR